MTRILESTKRNITPHQSVVVSERLLMTSKFPDQRPPETCYILRTYERHERAGLRNPWSLRQSLVYQKHECGTGRSVWIFVQLFQRCKEALWEEFDQAYPWRLTKPHILFLDVILSDWRWYFDDQRRSIRQYVSCISRLFLDVART
jgi:hypothetical protein